MTNASDADIEKAIANIPAETWAELRAIHNDMQNNAGAAAQTVSRFLYDHDLVLPFDWPKWTEGSKLFKSTAPNRLDSIDPVFALKLLIAINRSNRFNDGLWARLFESGDAEVLVGRLLLGEHHA